ncbi:MAG: GNAT family N-acetyltransferase [Planctomycetia bacterium]|nr:GNAT family N-acetyltransferase [Planctomycetia bacterium]
MEIWIREYTPRDTREVLPIWNRIVEEGLAFPQMEILTESRGKMFFSEQSFTGLACEQESGKIVGCYILHPNNIGRCGHICNASYAVHPDWRGYHIGEQLVKHSLAKGKELGFRILQFNAVVKSNQAALRLYEKLGFVPLGTIPGGFLRKDGRYEDIIPHYRIL